METDIVIKRPQTTTALLSTALAFATTVALLIGPARAMAASPSPAAASLISAAQDEVPEASEEDKVRAVKVLGIVADERWLSYNDRDFVFAIWQEAAGQPEIRAAAELALTSGAAVDYVSFIQSGIFDAKARDDAQIIRDVTAARQSREMKRSAAAAIGVVPDDKMLLLSVRDFIFELRKRSTGNFVREAALTALEGSAEDQLAFLQTGILEAVRRDQQKEIEDNAAADAAEKARLAARDAKRRAAAVLGIVADEVTSQTPR
jgi:hypothetical protein